MYSPELLRLCELETQICSYQGCACQAQWLEEYLDLGLAIADGTPETWQAGWLQRLFNTLSRAIKNPVSSQAWRQQCIDYLYLPFFALSQIYTQQPGKTCHLCSLMKQYRHCERVNWSD